MRDNSGDIHKVLVKKDVNGEWRWTRRNQHNEVVKTSDRSWIALRPALKDAKRSNTDAHIILDQG